MDIDNTRDAVTHILTQLGALAFGALLGYALYLIIATPQRPRIIVVVKDAAAPRDVVTTSTTPTTDGNGKSSEGH